VEDPLNCAACSCKKLETSLLIVFADKIRTEKVLNVGALIAFGASIFVWVVFFVWMLFCFQKTPSSKTEEGAFCFAPPYSLDVIGQGPLSLNGFKQKLAFPDMSLEVVLLAKNSRPIGKKEDFLLSLRSSGKEYKAKKGEQIFLNCEAMSGNSAPVYYFSDKKTPLWIKPLSCEGDKVLLEVGLFMPSKDSEMFQEEKVRFVLQEVKGSTSSKAFPPFVEKLKSAKLWGRDVVLQRFAHNVGLEVRDKIKLEIPGEKTIFCFLGKNDILKWDGANWTPDLFFYEEYEGPIAQVRNVTPKSIEIDVWEAEGFDFFPVRLELQGGRGEMHLGPHFHPTAIRLKSGKQVSCCFGKKRFMLKEGDWILKTPRGFRNLRRDSDREEYLSHKLQGELFIFDALVGDQGKFMMKGFLIDEMRTQAQPFSAHVLGSASSKGSSKAEKKQFFSRQDKEDVITYFPLSEQMQRGVGEVSYE
jgi:hypothetical protein